MTKIPPTTQYFLPRLGDFQRRLLEALPDTATPSCTCTQLAVDLSLPDATVSVQQVLTALRRLEVLELVVRWSLRPGPTSIERHRTTYCLSRRGVECVALLREMDRKRVKR